jgi:pimeloyl-ACP methyl ester carboxylesterase
MSSHLHYFSRIIIHGFGQNATSNINRDIKNGFLAQGDYNIIVADWSQSAGCIYHLAAYSVHSIGAAVGQFIDRLNANNQDIHIVGFDYGAHIASVASKTSQGGRVGRITGLDPAAKGIHVNNPAGRLNTGDATFVEVFHSNSGYLGIGIPIGNTDFYINDGINQPGCPSNYPLLFLIAQYNTIISKHFSPSLLSLPSSCRVPETTN